MPVTFVRKSALDDDPILLAAEKMEPALRSAFLGAVGYLKKHVLLQPLMDSIRNGDIDGALAAVAVDRNFTDALEGNVETGIESFKSAVRRTFEAGAKAALKKLPERFSVNISFSLTNQKSIEFLKTYSFSLIKQITDATRETIRDTIVRGFKEGRAPVEQAREIRESIGLTDVQERAVQSYRESLSAPETMRNALDRALRDGRYDRTVMAAIRNDTAIPQAQIDKMVDRYRQKFVAYRANVIARTESIRASNFGQRALWANAQQQGVLPKDQKRVWIVSGDQATCDDCTDLDGTEVGLDEEFAPGIMAPPDPHPQCRCSAALVFG